VGREYNSDKRQPKSYHIACVEMLSISHWKTRRQGDSSFLRDTPGCLPVGDRS
jgi:hypothetical protein